uniref:Uncharacterized protein n=1 Tax=Daphnia galeata TaxID=27404 RepID=A0A8J2RLE6_9CRUS|nr:unnamed protein product [Daphnia galeata]
MDVFTTDSRLYEHTEESLIYGLSLNSVLIHQLLLPPLAPLAHHLIPWDAAALLDRRSCSSGWQSVVDHRPINTFSPSHVIIYRSLE